MSSSSFNISVGEGYSLLCLLARQELGLAIQPRQVRLPPNGNDAGKDTPVLCRDKRKTKRCDPRPKLPRVQGTGRHGKDDTVPDGVQRAPGQKGLGTEEIGIEKGREEGEVDEDLGAEGQQSGRIVEVVREEEEPVVYGDGTGAANDEVARRPLRIVVVGADTLGTEVGDQVDDEGAEELCSPRPVSLRAGVGIGGGRQRSESLPEGHGRDGALDGYGVLDRRSRAFFGASAKGNRGEGAAEGCGWERVSEGYRRRKQRPEATGLSASKGRPERRGHSHGQAQCRTHHLVPTVGGWRFTASGDVLDNVEEEREGRNGARR
jgi:hypothetical protein